MHKSNMPLIAAIRCLPNINSRTKDFIIERIKINLKDSKCPKNRYMSAKISRVSYAANILSVGFVWQGTEESTRFWINVYQELENRRRKRNVRKYRGKYQ